MSKETFQLFKDSISHIDPVAFCEKYLTLDGEPFRLLGNGYKPFVDIYRYVGIKSLEDDSKPIVLVKGRQVGATTMAANLKMYFMASGLFGGQKAPMRLIHAFPTLVHVHRYAKTKLNTTINGSIPIDNSGSGKKKTSYIQSKIDKTSPSNDALQYKQFDGGNFIQVESTGLDADRLRGGTVDGLMVDECQDVPKLAINNATKLLAQSKYGPASKGIQLYFGTPKNKGTHYWDMWNASTQHYFHLGCDSCEKLFPLYTPGSDAWEKIWLTGFIVKCPHCGKEQDKREAAERGKWVSDRDEDECRYRGYHINMLYMPNFSKQAILDMKPENNPEVGEITYQNEVLGEFYAGDAAPITPDEIREKCGDRERKFMSRIPPEQQIKVYAGFDWGKKAQLRDDKGQSYSSAVVLAEVDGKLNIVYATLLKRNNFEEKQSVVEQILRQYSIKWAIGDIGYANDLTEVLQNKYSNFLASRAVGKLSQKIRMVDTGDVNQEVQFEKDYHLQEIFDLMKRGIVRFPFGDYEKISWLVDHCSSMELKVTRSSVNEPITRYIKGSTPNDGLMALLNAYLAYKFDKSGGFANSKGNYLTTKEEEGKMAITGYVPRM